MVWGHVSLKSSEAARLGRYKQAMEDGQYSKAALLFTSSGLIPQCYDEMLSKHPQHHSPGPDSTPSSLPTSPLTILSSVLLQAIQSFRIGTRSGLSGFCFSVLNILNHMQDFKQVACFKPFKTWKHVWNYVDTNAFGWNHIMATPRLALALSFYVPVITRFCVLTITKKIIHSTLTFNN